jgi:tRNA(fMet)-specific endonuclease VapC
MDGVVIDTSVLIQVEREGRDLDTLPEIPAAVSVVTVAELLHGARRADTPARRARREALAESVVTGLPIVDLDLSVARLYATLWAETAVAGTPVAAHDLMIAATAQLLDLPVWTLDVKDFSQIPGVRLVSP